MTKLPKLCREPGQPMLHCHLSVGQCIHPCVNMIKMSIEMFKARSDLIVQLSHLISDKIIKGKCWSMWILVFKNFIISLSIHWLIVGVFTIIIIRLFRNIRCLTFEDPSDYPIHKLVSHPMYSSKIKCTAGFKGDKFTIMNVDANEEKNLLQHLARWDADEQQGVWLEEPWSSRERRREGDNGKKEKNQEGNLGLAPWTKRQDIDGMLVAIKFLSWHQHRVPLTHLDGKNLAAKFIYFSQKCGGEGFSRSVQYKDSSLYCLGDVTTTNIRAIL
ncbi:hypothetical protein Taro_053386 [Colocasia esculenta]|uniref:Uncharacterized protein n=1 Tax=Colocasia esculenta TaxID=4460 RepID=A0A843XN07_COLES|nr:hypothetical protein [Colocasia esculenta]